MSTQTSLPPEQLLHKSHEKWHSPSRILSCSLTSLLCLKDLLHMSQKIALRHFVSVDVALRHNILWMIFYTHSTKMEPPQYVCPDVFHHDTLLLTIPNSHHTKLGTIHCGFSDPLSDSVTAWMTFTHITQIRMLTLVCWVSDLQYHGDTVPTIMSVQCSNISMWFTSRTNQLFALNLCFFKYKYNLEKGGKNVQSNKCQYVIT